MSKFCFVIPSFQHSDSLPAILMKLEKFNFKVFVVNDGSDSFHTEKLKKSCAAHEFIEMIEHPQNRGKGAAVSSGLALALEQGYTHAIQIDSDGQHDLDKIPDLIELSKEYPRDLISGFPVYDESVPKSRLYGRYATHIWVWIETLSFQIKDSLCGFRVYPLASTIELLRKHQLGTRMDFDIEIMVRLFWQGLQVRQLPVTVTYPENGVSHFDVLKDNIRISKMHTRLFFGMLVRFPKLLFRKRSTLDRSGNKWHQIEEFGSLLGIRILLFFYRLAGRKILDIILYPISFYYSLFSQNAKKSSRSYRQALMDFTLQKSPSFSTFQHVYSFAQTALDKFAVWFGDIEYSDLEKADVEELLQISKTAGGQGAFFITSHYGNIEVCRALGRFSKVKFNALVYYDNAKKFNSYLNKINRETSLNLMTVKNVGPEMSILLKEKLDQNEWVFMMGDRTSITERQRSMPVQVLGKLAHVSEGPFTMGYILDVPIYVIHCFRENSKFRIKLKQLVPQVERNRENRQLYIQQLADGYAAELEARILQDPLQWYNFFEFWENGIEN